MSGPVPSPSMNGITGWSGTIMRPSLRAMGSPCVTLMGFRSSSSSRIGRRVRVRRSPAEPARSPVGIDVEDLAAAMHFLHAVPERNVQQFRVVGEEDFEQLAPEPEEAAEFLGEDIPLADV